MVKFLRIVAWYNTFFMKIEIINDNKKRLTTNKQNQNVNTQ